MIPLDLAAIGARAEKAGDGIDCTKPGANVALQVTYVDVPALIAEIESLREQVAAEQEINRRAAATEATLVEQIAGLTYTRLINMTEASIRFSREVLTKHGKPLDANHDRIIANDLFSHLFPKMRSPELARAIGELMRADRAGGGGAD